MLIIELNDFTKYIINMNHVLEIRYDSSKDRHSITIFPDNESQPWVWTFKDKESLDKAYNRILHYNDNKVVVIDEGLA